MATRQPKKNEETEALQERIVKLEKQLESYKQSNDHFLKNKLFLHYDIKEPEQVVVDCETKLPMLAEVDKKSIEKGKAEDPTHLIIEGDNYHALSVLNYTHAGKIDLIYIDPPYNTGNKDFIYNDRFVDKEDSFRHSKWLSFMAHRLRLAKNLLAETGVIFISIDDNEQAHLKLLCDQIFGEENFVDCIVWDKKSSAKGVPPKNMLVNVHEYMMCYQKSNNFSFIGEPRSEGSFANPDNDPRGLWRNTNIKSTIKSKDQAFTIIDPETGNKYTDTWAYSKKELDRLIEEKVLIFPKNKSGQVRRKEYYSEMKNTNMALKSSWGLFDNQKNTEMLKEMLPDQLFLNPKPISLMEYLINVATNNSATILDFFAGSGTTGHAVLKLNAQDGGTRQFILCTNNENKIAEEVTYPRIKKVIAGYGEGKNKTAGIPANLRYFKTDFVEQGKNNDQTRAGLVARAVDMINIREATYEKVEVEKGYVFSHSGSAFTAIIIDSFKMADIWKEIENKNAKALPVKLYIFSFSDDTTAFTDMIPQNTTLDWESKSIPEGILQVYQRLFKKKDK